MPIELPPGFITRPEAPKKYNRSQRALERDLDVALAIQDQELLSHWKLVTKDGQVRDGGEVTVEMVKDLVTEGMTPAWCVAESFLEEKYGRKGEPRPRASTEGSASRNNPTESNSEPERNQDGTETEVTPLSKQPTSNSTFLKEIIRQLEHEKQQERERHDRIVTKLFEQLAVKDKQISAWDEVTQGLTKALATGQITPAAGLLSSGTQRQPSRPVQNAESAPADDGVKKRVVDATPAESAPKQTSSKDGTARPTKSPRRTKKKSSTTVISTDKPPSKNPSTKSSTPPKHKWYEIPTVKRIFIRSK